MTKTLMWTTALAAALAFSTPLEAAPKKNGKGGGGGGKRPAAAAVKKQPKAVAKHGGGGNRAKAMARANAGKSRSFAKAQQRQSPAVSQRGARGGGQNRAVAQQRALRQQQRVNQPLVAVAEQQRSVARQQAAARSTQRSIANQRAQASARNRQSIAFGGSTVRPYSPRIVNRTDNRSFAVNNYDYNYARPPYTVYQDWDRSRSQWWNDRQYSWYNDSWVALALPSLSIATGYSGYSSGSLASSVQAALDRQGYDPGPIDGVIGSQTRDAIADYQSDYGLAVTGEINDSLIQSLGL